MSSQGVFLDRFSDPEAVAKYAEGTRRFVPGLDALHRMAHLLLAERAPANARILVLGAGGGLELKALAEAHAEWTFVGVDPAEEMLRIANGTLGSLASRVELVKGTIDDAPEGPFDGATCLLTLHFLDAKERARTVREIHRRLKPGAAFVAAHGSFSQGEDRATWLDRYAAFAIDMGADPAQVKQFRDGIAASANMLTPEVDESILREGGFEDAALFFAAFTWRGWVAHA